MLDTAVNCAFDCVFDQSAVDCVFVDVRGASKGAFSSGGVCEIEVDYYGCMVGVDIIVPFV